MKNEEIPISLKKDKIDSFYLSNKWVGEWVFINERQIFFSGAGSSNFFLYDIITGKRKIIKFPDTRKSVSINGFFFDNIRNTICILVGKYSDTFKEELDYFFYLFHINDFSWEIVEELTNMINPHYHPCYYYYDEEDNILYFVSDNKKGEITSFDMGKKVILSKQLIPDFDFSFGNLIYNIGGDPVKVLFSYQKENSNYHGYGLFDFNSGIATNYFHFDASDRGGLGLRDFVYLNNGNYLCIDSTKGNTQKIVLLDLLNNEQIKDIYVEFNNGIHDISKLRKIFNGKYGFLSVSTLSIFQRKRFVSIFYL